MGIDQEFNDMSHMILIDGEFKRSDTTETREVIDPATENVIAEIAETPESEVNTAVASAAAAQKIWWRKSALERSEIMHEIAANMRESRGILGEMLTREMGKPYKETTDEVGSEKRSNVARRGASPKDFR